MRRAQRRREAAGPGFAREELLEQQRLAGHGLRRRRPGPSPASRRAASAGTRARGRRSAMPRSRQRQQRVQQLRARAPWPRRPCRRPGRCGRSTGPAALAACRVHRVAGGLQHAHRGDGVLGLEVAVEGVDEQHHGLGRLSSSSCAAWQAAATALRARRCRGESAAACAAPTGRASVRSAPRSSGSAVAQVEQPRQPAGQRRVCRAGGRPAVASA